MPAAPTIDADRLANAVTALKASVASLSYMGISIAKYITQAELEASATAVLQSDDKFRNAQVI